MASKRVGIVANGGETDSSGTWSVRSECPFSDIAIPLQASERVWQLPSGV